MDDRVPSNALLLFRFPVSASFLLSKKINTCSNDTCSNDDLRKAVADIVYIVDYISRYNEVQKTCETTPQDADTKQDQDHAAAL